MERYVRRVRKRLLAAGAELELWHLSRLSDYERAVLVRLERNGGWS